MRPSQIKLLKNIARILSIIIAAYFIFYHPIFVLIMILIVIVLGILIVIYLPKINDFIEDLTDNFNKD